jgi:hypothetical protein
MSWSEEIGPVTIIGGGRRIETLADASLVMMALPEHDRQNSQWRLTARLLIYAAEVDPRAADPANKELVRTLNGMGLI